MICTTFQQQNNKNPFILRKKTWNSSVPFWQAQFWWNPRLQAHVCFGEPGRRGWGGWRSPRGGDPGAGAPLPIIGLPLPLPGGLVGLSDNCHCDCHLQVTVTVTNNVHGGPLVWLVQSQECVEQAMGPPRLSHPGWGGRGSATTRSPRSCRTVVSCVACALPRYLHKL